MNAAEPQLTINTHLRPLDLNTCSSAEDHQEVSRFVRLSRVSPTGGGAIARSEDGNRCVVTSKETLRILRISPSSSSSRTQRGEHKSATGEGGYRIDASRNFWDNSGLKIDSTSTDVAWGYGLFNNKILTSARNGEVIMWDVGKAGASKYERRSKDHSRSINKLSVSQIVHHYCITGSADGDLRVWDLRDMTKSIMRVFHPTSVRSLVFSPSAWQPLQALVGLDNGSIFRWDLKMGQRGQLDRLHVAHTASVTSLDWCPVGGISMSNGTATSAREESSSSGLGWIVSGGLDRTVKVWDLTAPGQNTHIPHKPTYILHPSFPVRRVAWRPDYQCELAIVSNAEFAAVESQQTSVGINTPLARSGSMIGLDSLLRGPSVLDLAKENLGSTETTPSSFGDVIEIWDVRRSWIPKWSVSGSGAECGVSDIAFSGSHAIWAHHTSGAFTQFDLHETSKPLDSIPRAALSWEATGSMAFVVDRKDKWEVPYDDVKSDVGTDIMTEVGKPAPKALGDPVARITSQVVGNFIHDFHFNDINSFTTLARGYIFEGRDREEICAYNSGVALSAGNELAAQVWLLLGASIANYIPNDSQKLRSSSPHDMGQIKPSSEDASHLTEYVFPPSLGARNVSTPSSHKKSPGRMSIGRSLTRIPRSGSTSVSRRLTPASSASPSPQLGQISLPPISPRRPSFFRRDSADRGASANRRPSLTVSLGGSVGVNNGVSPGDKNTPSLRHVGEGVLDDSDSSGGSEGDGEGEQTAGPFSSDDSASKPSEPGPVGQRGLWHPPTAPSLLSQIQQQWWDGRTRKEDNDDDEDDEDASSPSPGSTSDPETDSQGLIPHRKPPSGKRIRRASIGKITKSRSRSSTVASLSAPLLQRPKPLTHQDSHSSIRTVTAAETSMLDHNAEAGRPGQNGDSEQDFRPSHTRQRSMPFSEVMFNPSRKMLNSNDHGVELASEGLVTERRIEIIRAEDKRYREVSLKTLKKVVEELSEEGDVQMCSMLSLVAAEELGISRTQTVRFLDSYIEILTRLRLHTCAAYVRKSCGMEDVRSKTLVGTIIYSNCGKCRKPVMLPAKTSEPNKGRYAYCSNCQAPCVRCSICHLPVQALLFQCSVCHHGGHQACYRNYYLDSPMVDLPTSFLPLAVDTARGQDPSRHPLSASSLDDDSVSMQSFGIEVPTPFVGSPGVSRTTSLKGYPCAAGCGHFCWASSGEIDEF